jgi:hypothetical protein
MLQSIKQWYGDKLSASDGAIGHVKDFYFDDQNWAIRYLVADTGSWLPGRRVLISPHSVGRLEQAGNVVRVNLTCKQVENSPSIESHKPVSRQYEEEYYRYFGWPYYWQGDALWGISGFPILELPPQSAPPGETVPRVRHREPDDAHLLNTKEVNGYRLQASDGVIGHICDFLMDTQSWAIRELVIKTGNRFSGHEVQIPVSCVNRISFKESAIFVNLTGAVVEKSPAHHLVPAGAGG